MYPPKPGTPGGMDTPRRFAALAVVPFGPIGAQVARGYLDGDEFVRLATNRGAGLWAAHARPARFAVADVLVLTIAPDTPPEALGLRRGEGAAGKRRFHAGERSRP